MFEPEAILMLTIRILTGTVLIASALVACTGTTGGNESGGPDAGGAADAGTTPWLEDPGANGFQIALPEVSVPAGQERAICSFAEVPDVYGNGSDVWISRWEIAMTPHAHELITYRTRTIVSLDGEPGTSVTDGACLEARNWADWPLVANSQQRATDEAITGYDLPAGVGHRFTPGQKLMLQVRFVNDGASEIKERAGVNFYWPSTAPTVELGTVRASKSALRVCQSSPTPTFDGACQIRGDGVTITGANGHLHSRGTQFSAYRWDGQVQTLPAETERIYQSMSWDHPVMTQGLAASLPNNGGVWWSCSYGWREPSSPVTCDALNAKHLSQDPGANPDCCYTSGEQVERDEQCTMFLYYYPKADDVNCY
jgi:hypothetical protein